MTYRDGLAIDAWLGAVPDNPYDPCPCGCGKAFRFVARDETTLTQHELAFRAAWLRDHPEPVADVVVPGVGPVFVCESCLRGDHQSCGCDHRNGPEDRRGCKNLSPDGKRQCLCSPDWPELDKAISRHSHSESGPTGAW